MRCPKCDISLQSHYAFCPSCGERIGPETPRPWKILGVVSILIFALSAALLIMHHTGYHLHTDQEHSEFSQPEKPVLPEVLIPDAAKPGKDLTISVGKVVITDIAGNRVAEMPGAVTGGGWAAVPAKLGIGGYQWYFQPSGNEMLEILGGRIGDHDTVGIWQLRDMTRLPGPPLFAGNPAEPMRWISLVSELALDIPRAEIIARQQNFIVVSLPASIRDPGVYVQNNAVVGWSFGPYLEHGYIWRGPDEENLVYELSVDDYYRLTFENSREEAFIIAWSKRDADSLEKLRLFADGFRRPSRLSEKEKPPHLTDEAVRSRMHHLVSELVRAGRENEVFSVFDSSVFSGAADAELLTAVFSKVSHSADIARAVGIIEGVLRDPGGFLEKDEAGLRGFLMEIYGRWLNRMIESGDYAGGLAVYERAADYLGEDPHLRLMGAEMALAFEDWRTAEKLIRSQVFPMGLADKANRINERIRLMKTGADTITVRFAAGPGRIDVPAVLNRRLQLDFIVDTGASMVTIPVAAARRLGIYDAAAPRKRVVTAGGIVYAPSVVIDTIAVDGWAEIRVEAVVMDLPEYPGIGLLGMNYLNRFKMEVNADEGMLTLTPR